MSRLISLLGLLFLLSCSGISSSTTLTLDYDDFGPQVVAHEVIGMDWWQWQPHGDSRPSHYPIKVVVYKGISLPQVKAQYPVKPELEQDYRYLEYTRAMDYLDTLIADDVMPDLTQQLKTTKAQIETALNR